MAISLHRAARFASARSSRAMGRRHPSCTSPATAAAMASSRCSTSAARARKQTTASSWSRWTAPRQRRSPCSAESSRDRTKYKLFRGTATVPDDGNWYLRSSEMIRSESGAYAGNQGAAFTMFRPSMRGRAGASDPRGRTGAGNAAAAWAQVDGTDADFKLIDAGLDLSQRMHALQVGADMVMTHEHGATVIGAMLGTGKAETTSLSQSTGLVASGDSRGKAIGVYGSWYERADVVAGAYIDAWLQYGRFDQGVQGEQLAQERYDAHTFAASFESGYDFRALQREKATLHLVPQAQLVLTRHDVGTHVEQNGTRVEGGKEALDTRIGLQASARIRAAAATITPYVSTHWLHGGGDTWTMTFDGTPVSAAVPASRRELGLGVQFSHDAGWNACAEATRETGDNDYRQVGAQLGVAYRW